MKTSKYAKIKTSAEHLLILALLLTLVWYLAFDPGVEESMGSFALIVLWIVVLSAILVVSVRWYNQLKGVKIYPFVNATGDKEHKDEYDAFAYNFTDLLQLEMQGINELIYIPVFVPEQTRAPEAEAAIRPTTRPTAASATRTVTLRGTRLEPPRIHISGAGPYNLMASRADEQVSETLNDVGTIDVGPVNLPLGGLLNLVTRALRGPGINGGLQKYGERLAVVASYDNRKWEVSTDISSINGEPIAGVAIRGLAHQLAIKMVSEVGEHTTANWRSFDELVKGLDCFQRYLQSGRSNLQALEEAKKQFEKSALLDEQFGLAYYYLGQAYEGQSEYESAFEMYRLAVQIDPKLREGYLRLGVMYTLRDQYVDAIEAAKRAIEFANKAGQPFPEARTHLGTWLVTMAEDSYRDNNIQDAINYCRQGIKRLHRAEEEYKRSVKNTQGMGVFSLQLQSNLSENQIDVQIRLSRAYSSLADYLEQESRIKTIIKGRSYQYRIKAEKILKESLELNPNKVETLTELATYYISRGDFSRARKYLEHALGIRPEDITIHLDIGNLYLEPAYSKIIEEVDIFLEDPEKWLNERDDARIKEIFQQFQAAEWYFQKVLDITRQRTIEIEDSSYETLQAVTGLANVSGALGLFNAIHDMAFNLDPQYEEYRRNVQYAEALLGKAVVLNPFDVSVYGDLEGIYGVEAYILENCLARMEDQETAEFDIEEMKARSILVENTRPAYTNLIDILTAFEGLPAEQAYREVVGITAALALSSREQRENDELVDPLVGVEELEKLLAGVDEGEETRVYLWVVGWMLYYLEEYESCRRFIEKAEELGSFVEADLIPYDLGNLYFRLQGYDKAIERYLDVETADPYFWQSRLALIEIFQEVEQSGKLSLSERVLAEGEEPLTLVRVYQLALEASTNNPYRRALAFASLADYYYSYKSYDLARHYCDEAKRLVPGYNYPYIVLAFIYMDLQDYPRAIENWESLRALNPHQDMYLFHLGLGDAYFNQGLNTRDKEEKDKLIRRAVAEYREALNLFEAVDAEDESVTLAVMGQALVELKEYKQAELAYISAMELQRGSSELNNLYTQLAFAYVKQKQFGLAKQEYLNAIHFCEEMINQAEEADDTMTMDHYRLGLAHARNLLAYYVYAERGINLEDGLALVNQALEDLDIISAATVEMDELRGAFLDTRGWIHFKLGNYQAAYDDLDKALSLTMGTEFEHAHMAIVCKELANVTENESEQKRLRLKAHEQEALAIDMDKEGLWEMVSKLYGEESRD